MEKNFALIDENNKVIMVVVGDSIEKMNEMIEGNWVQTFPGVEGKVHAGVGHTYIPEEDNFLAPESEIDWEEAEKCGCEKPWEHIKVKQ
jgi:hypothetical protein